MRRLLLAGAALVLAACGTAEPRPVPTAPTADPVRAEQWALDQLEPEQVWSTTRGSGVTVAVVDSGVDIGQADLAGRVDAGIDLVDPGTPQDDVFGHGTHVAGIIAAATDDGFGMAGLAPDARILPVRVLDDAGSGSFETTARGITWAVENGADVINLSLTLNRDDAAVRRAVAQAVAQGVIVVAAAGNRACPAEGTNDRVYPAAYPGVIGVGSVSEHGNVSPFSSCGPWVDLVAPGAGIVSIVPDGATKSECVDSGGTCTLSGTSEAAPYVAAAAALALAVPGTDPKTVADRLIDGAEDVAPPGRDDRSGAGLLDLAALLTSG